MESYKNLGGNSGVAAYEIGSEYINVQFKHGTKIYTYSTRHITSSKIEQMKALAIAGQGLGTFINQNRDVHDGYDR
jgi:hypothetical protein